VGEPDVKALDRSFAPPARNYDAPVAFESAVAGSDGVDGKEPAMFNGTLAVSVAAATLLAASASFSQTSDPANGVPTEQTPSSSATTAVTPNSLTDANSTTPSQPRRHKHRSDGSTTSSAASSDSMSAPESNYSPSRQSSTSGGSISAQGAMGGSGGAASSQGGSGAGAGGVSH
jgi:hypothetical protein